MTNFSKYMVKNLKIKEKFIKIRKKNIYNVRLNYILHFTPFTFEEFGWFCIPILDFKWIKPFLILMANITWEYSLKIFIFT